MYVVCVCLREAWLLWPAQEQVLNVEGDPLELVNQLIPSAEPNKHSNASEVLKLLCYTQIVTKKWKQKTVFHFLCSTWNDNHLRCACMCVCTSVHAGFHVYKTQLLIAQLSIIYYVSYMFQILMIYWGRKERLSSCFGKWINKYRLYYQVDEGQGLAEGRRA